MRTGWMSAEEASDTLGVKRRTLYTYASRGWIRTSPDADRRRRRRYLAADVLSLRRRAEAHRGALPAAAGALDWGPAVLASSITSIDVDGPNYRGIPALELVEGGVHFRQVCEILLGESCVWPDAPHKKTPVEGPPMRRLRRALVDAAEEGIVHGPTLMASLVVALGGRAAGEHMAARLAPALGLSDSHAILEAIDAALILCADHELNASAFAGRVAASAGASLADALLAALCTLSGSRHGGLSDAAEVWMRGHEHRPPPIVGHPLYADGDPRAEHLIERAVQLVSQTRRARLAARLHALSRAGAPNLDAGLAALCFALDAREGSAFSLFAIGRTVGWIAHIREQQQGGGPLRPRARYTGP